MRYGRASAFAAAIFSLCLTACGGGGGGGGSVVPVSTATPTTQQFSPPTQSTVASLPVNGGTVSLGGVSTSAGTANAVSSATVVLPALSGATTATVGLSASAPNGVVAPQMRSVKTQTQKSICPGACTFTPLAYLSLSVSPSVSITQTPHLTVTFPPNVGLGGGRAFIVEYSQATGPNWNQVAGPIVVNGNTLDFPSVALTPSPLTLQANTPYYFAIVTTGYELTTLPANAGTVTMTIGGPNASVQSRAKYISPGIARAEITLFPPSLPIVSGTSSIGFVEAPCSAPTPAAPCTLSMQAAPGQYAARITTSDALGLPLSHVDELVTVAPSTTTTINATLNASVQRVNLSLAQPLLHNGSPQTTQLLVSAYDYDGYLIIAPGNYDTPISLQTTATDPALASALTISKTTVNGPSDTITVNYDGTSWANLLVVVTPQTLQTNGQYAQTLLDPQLPTTMYTIPSGTHMMAPPVAASDGSMWAGTTLSAVRVAPNGQLSEFCTNPGASMIAPGANGKVFLGSEQGFMPSPFGGYSCNSTAITGLRGIDASGNVTQTAVSQLTRTELVGPELAPDGTMWAKVPNYHSSDYFVHFDANGNIIGGYSAVINGGGFATGNSMPAIAPDGSFWYLGGGFSLRCTSTGCTNLPTIGLGGGNAVAGSNNDMLVSTGNDLYDVDLNANVLAHTSGWSNSVTETLCGAFVKAGSVIWCGAIVNIDGHLQLLRVNGFTGGYAMVQLNATEAQPIGLYVSGVGLGPDGRLWFIEGNRLGVATIQ